MKGPLSECSFAGGSTQKVNPVTCLGSKVELALVVWAWLSQLQRNEKRVPGLSDSLASVTLLMLDAGPLLDILLLPCVMEILQLWKSSTDPFTCSSSS